MAQIKLNTIISYLENTYDFEVSTDNIEYNIYNSGANIECYISENPDPNYENPFEWELRKFSIDFEDTHWKKWAREEKEAKKRSVLFSKINNTEDKEKARKILKSMGVTSSYQFRNLENKHLENIIKQLN